MNFRLAALVALLALLPLSAQGGWQVQVLAHTALVARVEVGLDLSARVEGRLVDDLNRGVGHRSVTLSLFRGQDPSPLSAPSQDLTDEAGAFTIPLPLLPPGIYRARLAFEGDDALEKSMVELEVRLQPSALSLAITLPDRVPSGAPATVVITARAEDGGPASVPLGLQVSNKAAFTVWTDQSGWAEAPLPSWSTARPGEVRVKVTYPGSPRFAAVSSEARLLVASPTYLTLETSASRLRQGEGLVVQGVLSDDKGPLTGREVRLELAGQTSWAPTGKGGFRARLSTSDADVGVWRVMAAFEPGDDDPALDAARAAPVELEVLAAPPLSVAVYLAAALALALLLAASLYPLALRRFSSRRPEAPAADEPLTYHVLPSHEGPPEVPADQGSQVAVLLWDRDAEVVVEGTLELEGAVAQPIGKGWHLLPPLGRGKWPLVARAKGYLDQRVELPLPLKRSGRAVRMDMRSVRWAVRLVYEGWEAKATGEARFGLSTPAEVLASLDQDREGSPGQLATVVERAYFGLGPHGTEMVDLADRLASEGGTSAKE